MRRNENFVARPYSHRVMKQESACRPRRTEHRLFRADVSSQFGFESFAFFGQNVRSRIKRAQRDLAHFFVSENARKRNFYFSAQIHSEMSIHFPVRADSKAASTTLIALTPSNPSTSGWLRFSIESTKAASSARSGSSGVNSS